MKSKFLPLFFVACLSPVLSADTISWVGTSTGDWTTPTNWSNSAAPAAGNTYAVSGTGKLAISPSTGSVTFAGDALSISSAAKLRLYTVNGGTNINDTFTIPNLSLDGATISPASSLGSVTQILANQALLSNAVVVELNETSSNSNVLTFNSGFIGSGTLAIQRSGTTGNSRSVNIAGTNSTAAYSGNVTASGNSSSKTTSVTISTGTGWGSGTLSIGQWFHRDPLRRNHRHGGYHGW
ncbi:MAG: hypothetical protein QM755_16040 [Luteolibacter sp.]